VDQFVQGAAIPAHSFPLPLLPNLPQQSPSTKPSSEFSNNGTKNHHISVSGTDGQEDQAAGIARTVTVVFFDLTMETAHSMYHIRVYYTSTPLETRYDRGQTWTGMAWKPKSERN